MEIAFGGRQVVGMDLHRHRSVLLRMTEDGRRLATARITNGPQELRREIARARKSLRVVLGVARCGGASGASAEGEGVLLPAGQKRCPGRGGSGRCAADGPAGGGVDRPRRRCGSCGSGPVTGTNWFICGCNRRCEQLKSPRER